MALPVATTFPGYPLLAYLVNNPWRRSNRRDNPFPIVISTAVGFIAIFDAVRLAFQCNPLCPHRRQALQGLYAFTGFA
jgi:hypothetical protein